MSLAYIWKRVVEKTLSRMDRLTHTWYRRRARRRMQQRTPPRSVVVVCYGNICRSPYAAAVLRQRLTAAGVADVEIGSAGIIGPDRPANTQGAAVALERGLDLGSHRSRLFTAQDAHAAELILVMTRSQRDLVSAQFSAGRDRVELLGDFDSEDPPYREISDPYGHPDEEFRRVFGQIDRSVEGLSAIWRERHNQVGNAL